MSGWLEPRRRVDNALYAVVMEAYIGGISTRKVDALVEALGCAICISKPEVSRICQSRSVSKSVSGPIFGPCAFPLRLPGCHLPAREAGPQPTGGMQVLVVANRINDLGYREVLGIAADDSVA